MYSLSIRDHLMIAHSFRGEIFGPAQGMHGATYVIDVAFRRSRLDADGLVVDIGAASDLLHRELGRLNYKNLDEVPEFAGQNTTTEFLAKVVFDRLAARIASGELGSSARGLVSLCVELHESHIASAAYDAPLQPTP